MYLSLQHSLAAPPETVAEGSLLSYWKVLAELDSHPGLTDSTPFSILPGGGRVRWVLWLFCLVRMSCLVLLSFLVFFLWCNHLNFFHFSVFFFLFPLVFYFFLLSLILSAPLAYSFLNFSKAEMTKEVVVKEVKGFGGNWWFVCSQCFFSALHLNDARTMIKTLGSRSGVSVCVCVCTCHSQRSL